MFLWFLFGSSFFFLDNIFATLTTTKLPARGPPARGLYWTAEQPWPEPGESDELEKGGVFFYMGDVDFVTKDDDDEFHQAAFTAVQDDET